MMRTAAPIHSHCYNMILSLLEREVAVGERLPVQTELAVRCQASQATISRALRELKKTGLVAEDGEGLCLRRKPGAKHAQPPPSSLSRRDEVERRILAMLTAGELNPGMTFSELALARKFGVTTGTVREALLRLARLGIFTKPARRRWQFARLNEESINHLMDLRMLIAAGRARSSRSPTCWNGRGRPTTFAIPRPGGPGSTGTFIARFSRRPVIRFWSSTSSSRSWPRRCSGITTATSGSFPGWRASGAKGTSIS